MAKYVSGRQKNLKVGISSYSENLTSIQVIGNVGVGTTNATSKLYVVGDGYFTGVVTATNINVSSSSSFSQLYVSGITTLAANGGITTTGGDLYVGGDLYIADDLVFDEFTARNGNITGVATIATLNNTVGTITNLSGTNVNYTGVGTIATLNSNVTNATNLNGTNLNYTGVGTITTLGSTNGTITNLSGTIGTITTLRVVTGIITNINSSGVITATQFSTGSGTLGFTTNTISGPEEIIIDPLPVGVGTTSGVVRIKGDLYVDGTQFIVNSTTIELADFNVGIASTVGSNALLDGAGIGIGSANIRKTFTYASGSDALKSSENFDLASGKSYKINGTTVLSSSQLTVPNINATGVGTIATLNSTVGTITTFNSVVANIDNLNVTGVSTISVNSASDALRITQTGSGNALVVEDSANPDTTPFVIKADGGIGIKTTSPQSALDVRGTISIGRTDVAGINSIRSVIDINSWEYGGVFKSVSSEDGSPQDIYFKDDGTKMFILGDSGNEVNEYALSTAWDVSTAGFTTVFSTASQETNPLGLYFKPDGTRMYICGNTAVSPANADQVRSYTLSTPWSIASGSITYDNKAYSTTSDTAPQGVYFKDDGLKMYVVGSANDTVYEYSLSTAWELDSTITLLNTVLVGAGNALNLPLTLTAPAGIDFNASGTKMYITDSTRDVVARFDLAAPWDTTTISFFDNVYVGFQELTPTGIFYQEDQSKAYIVGSSSDTVYQFNTDVPSLELASSGISTRSSIILNNEARLNNRLYVTDTTHIGGNTTLKGTLQVDSNLTVSGGTITAGNVAATLLGGNTTTAVTLANSQTTGTLQIGAAAQTGTMSVGLSTASQTTNIQAGANVSGTQKTINLGTGGLSGSRTLINIGPTAGVGTVVINTTNNVGIGSTLPTSVLDVVGDVKISGVATATTFIGALTGIAASATQLVTPRTFQITGDVVASAISFDGTGNVSLAATIQPNSVGLGTDTTGDYVQSIAGTANQITVTGGTGEGSTPTLSIPNQFTVPQDVTVTRDLQVNRNLNVTGNITIGGTSATIFSQSLNIFDPDIVLGFRTDGSGNDVANDNTANHGGIAIASTEGTPLVQLFIAGIETNPATYKKIMWFKAGTFAGLGTDAWLSNYAVGIGSTQFPTGTRLAAGAVQFTENDLSVIRNINASGIITATTGSITTINGTTANYSVGNIVTGVITNAQGTNLNYSGIGTITNLVGTNINYTGVGTIATFNATTSTITNANGTNLNFSGLSTATTLRGNNINYSGVGTITTFNATTSTITNETGTNLNFSGVGTITTFNATTSTITNETGTNLNFSGVGTVGSLNIGATQLISSARQLQNIASLDATTTATIESAIANAPNTFTDLQVTGVSTFTNGPVLIGSGTSTGTASQRLQVTGGAYVSDNLGVGNTNPGAKLDVTGDIRLSAADPEIEFNSGGPRLKVPAANTLTIHTGGGLNSTTNEAVRINTTGVGIGTDNPSSKLHVYGGNLTIENSSPGPLDGPYIDFKEIGFNDRFGVFADFGGSGDDNKLHLTANSSGAVPQTSDAKVTLLPSGAFLIGSVTPTGTASQRLQVTGGAYVSGNLGVGITNPQSTLHLQSAAPTLRFTETDAAANHQQWMMVANNQELYWQAQTDAYSGGGNLFKMTRSNEQIQTFEGQNSGVTWFTINNNTQRVGIGTTNPLSPLEVAQDTTGVHDLTVTNLNTGNNITKASRIRFRLTDTVGTRKDVAYITAYPNDANSALGDYLSFFTRTLDSNPTEKMRLDNNGNLVLGSSFTATGTASQPLQVTGGGYFNGSVGIGRTNPSALLHLTGGSAIGVILERNSTGESYIRYQNSSGTMHAGISTGATFWGIGDSTNFTTAPYFVVTNTTGNVGVGTNNPGAKLEVTGDIRVSANSGSFRTIGAADSSNTTLLLQGGAASGIGGNIELGRDQTNYYDANIHQFRNVSAGTEYARLNGSGNLLISNTTDTGTANQKLQVTGGAYVSGSLGIGITNPAEKLEVSGNYIKVKNSADVGAGLVIESGNATSVASQIFLRDRTFDKWTIRKNSSNDFDIYNYNTSSASLTIKPSGNIGINSTSPTSILDVLGDAKVSGVVTATTFIGQINSGVGTIATLNSTVATLTNLGGTNLNFSGVGTITTLNVTNSSITNINSTGVITATQFTTGSGNLGFTTNTINGPSEIIIDPAPVGVGTTSGIVRIRGDLYVDGTQFVVNSTTIELADFNVGIASTVGTNALLDGAGIGIGSANIRKTFTYNNTANTLESSIGLGVTSGGSFKTGTSTVLTSTTLGSGVVNSSLTSVGTLGQLNVSGVSTFQSDVYLGDDDRLRLGDSNELQIYHNSSNNHSIISENGGGDLRISADRLVVLNPAATETVAIFDPDGAVELYYDNSKKFETTGYGATVFGTLQSQDVNVSGITTSPTYDTVSTRTGSATATTTTTSQTAIHTGLPSASYRSVEYLVQAVQSTNFHTTKILVVHDGTTAYLTEYGTVFNNSTVASYDVDISGGNLRLLATPSSASSTTFKVSFTSIVV